MPSALSPAVLAGHRQVAVGVWQGARPTVDAADLPAARQVERDEPDAVGTLW